MGPQTFSPRARTSAALASPVLTLLSLRPPFWFVADEKNRLAAERDNRSLPEFTRRVPKVIGSTYRDRVRRDRLEGGEIAYAEARHGYEWLLDNAHRIAFSENSADVGGQRFPIKRNVSPERAQAALEREIVPSFAALPIAYFRAQDGSTYLLFQPSISASLQAKTKEASIRNRRFALQFLKYMAAKHARGLCMQSMSLLSALSLSNDALLVDEVQVSRADEGHSLGREFLITAAIFLAKGMINDADLGKIVRRYYASSPVNRAELEAALAPSQAKAGAGVARAVSFVESLEKQRTPGITARAANSIAELAAKFF